MEKAGPCTSDVRLERGAKGEQREQRERAHSLVHLVVVIDCLFPLRLSVLLLLLLPVLILPTTKRIRDECGKNWVQKMII